MSYSRRSRYSLSPSPYRRDSRPDSRSLSRLRSRSSSRDVENPGNNLYVTGLSPRITNNELEKHFSGEGTVIDVHLVVDPCTRVSRGFGFVIMSTVEEADHCIKCLDRSVLEGRVITVEKCIAGLLAILLVDILAPLLIGGAGVRHRVIHLNVTGIDRSPHVTVDANRILQTFLDLRLHLVGPLSASMTGPTRLITHQRADTIEDTAIALYLAVLLHAGLRGGIHEACPQLQGGGAIHTAYPLHQEGGAIHEASPLAQGGGGAQGEAIHVVYPLHQGGVVLEVLLQGEGRARGVDALETAAVEALKCARHSLENHLNAYQRCNIDIKACIKL
ncbi:hypothetical protein SADUNF_Sadunf05G0137300 [Salix dunnii]|uniref:RRM domain-containing protein n=1 Tax=Salix dunnii TaxID=1413687 RepID=A0A835K661_9ROSI|nr:hypothetical protein SADUNF_Sadunf05G0137300 [Salix dunnii]